MSETAAPEDIETLAAEVRACRHCVEALPHEPRPVLQVSSGARIGVFGQAPGNLVHLSGRPFTDPSGVRLRQWMGVSDAEFYDGGRIAIIPMGFCFPGYDAKGGDLPPRKECADLWRARLMAALPDLDLMLLVGSYAQKWHLGQEARRTLTDTVANWSAYGPRLVPLPHPSWRNNGWIKKHPWFETELVPYVQARVRHLLA